MDPPWTRNLTDVEHVDMSERVERLGREDVAVGEEQVVLLHAHALEALV